MTHSWFISFISCLWIVNHNFGFGWTPAKLVNWLNWIRFYLFIYLFYNGCVVYSKSCLILMSYCYVSLVLWRQYWSFIGLVIRKPSKSNRKIACKKEKAIVLSSCNLMIYWLIAYWFGTLADWLCRSACSGTLCFMHLVSGRSLKFILANFF